MLKRLVFAACIFLVLPLILASWLEDKLSIGDSVFSFCAQLLALFPGTAGSYCRVAYYFGSLENSSWEAAMAFGSFFTKRGGGLGKHASVGAYCVLGRARVGTGVMMGSRVSIPSGKRQHFDEQGSLSRTEGQFDLVEIGESSWIGEGAIVLANVGRAAVVSAGSVIVAPVADSMLVAGNPARDIRQVDSAARNCGRVA